MRFLIKKYIKKCYFIKKQKNKKIKSTKINFRKNIFRDVFIKVKEENKLAKKRFLKIEFIDETDFLSKKTLFHRNLDTQRFSRF